MKGQDVLVALELLSLQPRDWSYHDLAEATGLSVSEAHAAVRRCIEAGLVEHTTRAPNRKALREFLVHAVRYVFPASPGDVVDGLPTSFAAPPLNGRIRFHPEEAHVMPLPGGPMRGRAVKPLYRSAPEAAARDPRLHELLALIDALRTGRVRERKLAAQALERLLD